MSLSLAKYLLDPRAEQANVGAALVVGALVWGGYSILQVLVNGIVIDETVIAAQVIAGAVTYPPGHPHGPYYEQAYSLPHYLAAAWWRLDPSALSISAARNWLFLFLSTTSAHAMALVLTRRQVWGFVAGTLVVLESYLRFSGLYPMTVFPLIYSNGHVGLQLSVLIVALLIGGFWRTSALLLGLFPSIHAAHALPILAWSAVYIEFRRRAGEIGSMRGVLLWGGVGLAVSAGLAVLIAYNTGAETPIPPYDVQGDADAIRDRFRLTTDGHRQAFPVFTFAYLVNPIAFFALCAVVWGRMRQGARDDAERAGASALLWTASLGAMLWAYVYGARILEGLGFGVPGIVVASMPARFSNVTAVLLVPVTVAGIAAALCALDAPRRFAGLLAVGAMLLAAGLVTTGALPMVSKGEVVRTVLILAWGIVFGLEFAAGFSELTRRGVAVAAFVVLSATLAAFLDRTYVVAYFVVACAGTWVVLWVAGRISSGERAPSTPVRALVSAVVLAGISVSALAALPGRDHFREAPNETRWDMMSDYDRTLRDWLRANASREDLVLPFFGPIPRAEIQAKTDQPVLFELKTLWIMSYMPGLAPTIARMARELYGLDYTSPEGISTLFPGGKVDFYAPSLRKIWMDRTRDEWRALADRYRFRLVLSLSDAPPDLEPVLPGPRWTLYRIE